MDLPNKKIKNFLIIFFLTIIFSLIIFFVKNFYFEKEKIINNSIEEKYIEPIVLESPKESLYDKISKDLKKEKKNTENIKKTVEVDYFYLPANFKKNLKAQIYEKKLDIFFSSKTINEKLKFLQINLYKNKKEVRWRMKNAKVHLFGILYMSKKEFLAVCIHEFWHFLDLYILEKKSSLDLSEIFYNISWNSTSVIKKGLSHKDFVSGYSMTNKYEDFAESFTYYILHNKDFLKKSESSKILKQKYNFFKNYIFTNKEFQDYDDNKKQKIKNYYRDITKIDYNLENFLNYMKILSQNWEKKFLKKTFWI